MSSVITFLISNGSEFHREGQAANIPRSTDENDVKDQSESFQFVNPLRTDNGMLQLILQDLADRLISDMGKDEETSLTQRQAKQIRNRIKGFYSHMKDHPALNADRVMFASQKPNFLPSLEPSIDTSVIDTADRDTIEENGLVRKKKQGAPFQEVCRSASEWVGLENGITREGIRVNLYEQQYFHVTRCRNAGQACTGIAEMFASKCLEKPSWNIAYTWSEEENQYKWDWISINTCCSCAISESN
ncbi:venom nerve growth factor-like [Glandiceps talaboti]